LIEEIVVSEAAGHVSPTLSDDIERELAGIGDKHRLWLQTRTEFDEDDDTLLIVVTIPDDDPFEPTRLDRIFESVESVIVSHMPHDFPIHEEGKAWLVCFAASVSRLCGPAKNVQGPLRYQARELQLDL
jgi:hypothetical protein